MGKGLEIYGFGAQDIIDECDYVMADEYEAEPVDWTDYEDWEFGVEED